MKTIKQIADEIGVSKQAIFYRIKRPPLSNTLQSFISKLDGVLMVDFNGETLIKQAFSDDTVKTFGDKEPSKENGTFDGEVIRILQESINALHRQLEVKDKQIEELTAAVREQAESINLDRKNELAGTIIDGQKLIGNGQQKKAWWQFWK